MSKASRDFVVRMQYWCMAQDSMQSRSLLMIAGHSTTPEKGAASWLATPKEAGGAALLKSF